MIGKILAVPGEQRAAWSDAIVRWLKSTDSWLPASGVVAMFGGGRSEPDLLPLISWLNERGVGVAFFGIEANAMHPYRIKSIDDLRVGKFGVLEPDRDACTCLSIADLGVILTPGIAFESSHGHRMGRGAGYYDRFFSAPDCRAKRIGVGFSLQFCESLLIEDHDVFMQAFVTENGWIHLAE